MAERFRSNMTLSNRTFGDPTAHKAIKRVDRAIAASQPQSRFAQTNFEIGTLRAQRARGEIGREEFTNRLKDLLRSRNGMI